MKKIVLFFIVVFYTMIFGAYLKNVPMSIQQPNGDRIDCFASGDEYFNRLHDERDYTIIQASDGWYYYGVISGDDVIPSKFIAGSADPASSGLRPGARISEKKYKESVNSFNNFTKPKGKDAPTTGTINNLAIFIRFADESESIFNTQRSYYDNYFNKSDGPSLDHYFKEVSYNQLEVSSTYYPHVEDFSTNISYQDIYNRAYYQPYNATTNPIGYEGGDNGSERTAREHALLERAVNAISSEVPAGLNVDSDNDGYVDNIVFLISGSPGAWASLLWPHRWALFSSTVYINGKIVWDYNFDLTGTTTYFTVGVICHEFFHTLGAPDLYHYYDTTSPDAVGQWDVMNATSNPPQYMGAWMKYKYGDWIASVPVISEPGVYTLNPLSSPTGNIYRINSPNSINEFFIVEYRKQTGLYESSLPGSDDGMLIYRINSSYEGNADGPPDEVYIYRPGGTLTANGILNNALFSNDLSRTAFNDLTDPSSFLSNGSSGLISIEDIGVAGATISFTISSSIPPPPPKNLFSYITYDAVELNWEAPETVTGSTLSHYLIYRNGSLIKDNHTQSYYTDSTVIEDSSYVYEVSAYFTGEQEGETSKINVPEFTFRNPYGLPYTTGFAVQDLWSQVSYGCSDIWYSSPTSVAGGTSPEMKSEYENSNSATSRLVSPPLSTTGMDSILLTFKHFYDGYSTGIDYKIQISSNKTDWTDTEWAFAGSSNDAGPEEINLVMTEFPDPLYIAWTLDGNIYNFNYWHVDDINIEGFSNTLESPANVTTSVISSTLTIDWDIVPNAGSYLIYSSNDPYGIFDYLTNVSTNSWNTPVNTETKYFYYIVASTATLKADDQVNDFPKKIEVKTNKDMLK